jgi:predicted O-methyltransferase YrrM
VDEAARDGVPGVGWHPPAAPANRYVLPRQVHQHHPGRSPGAGVEAGWRMPRYLARGGEAWLDALTRLYADPITFPASISPQAGMLLHALILNLQPRAVVEVGTFLGVSTLWIAGALRELGGDRQVFSFDDFTPIEPGPWRERGMDDRLERVRRTLEEGGVAEVVRLRVGRSATQLALAREELIEAGGVQAALLDGDHTIRGVWKDLWALEPVLDTGGYLLLHDIFPEHAEHAGPRHVLDHVGAWATGVYESVELHLSPLNFGLGVLRRVG